MGREQDEFLQREGKTDRSYEVNKRGKSDGLEKCNREGEGKTRRGKVEQN